MSEHLNPTLRFANGVWTLNVQHIALTDDQIIERRAYLLSLNTLPCGCTHASHVAQGCWS